MPEVESLSDHFSDCIQNKFVQGDLLSAANDLVLAISNKTKDCDAVDIVSCIEYALLDIREKYFSNEDDDLFDTKARIFITEVDSLLRTHCRDDLRNELHDLCELLESVNDVMSMDERSYFTLG